MKKKRKVTTWTMAEIRRAYVRATMTISGPSPFCRLVDLNIELRRIAKSRGKKKGKK